jgi:pilus assembly protein CpaB
VALTASLIPEDPDSTSIRPYPTAEHEKTKAVTVRKSGAWKNASVLAPPPPAPLGVKTVTVQEGGLTRSWRPFAIASVFAVIAIGVAALLFDGTTKRVRLGWDLTPVIVAAQDMPEGTVVTTDMISERAVPEQFITSSVVRPDSVQYLVNQKILVPAQAGDPLLWTQFEASRANERLSSKVTKHARAYDLLTGRLIAVGGWVQPNDRIDIIAEVRPNVDKSSKLAITLLQDVTVLSTGKITVSSPSVNGKIGDRDYVDVSLLLLPEEAEIIALANELGELQFTLRTDDDHEVMTDHRGTSSKTLLEGERVRLLQVKRSAIITQVRKQQPK